MESLTKHLEKIGRDCIIDTEETFVNSNSFQKVLLQEPTYEYIILHEEKEMPVLSGFAKLDVQAKGKECSGFPLALTLEEIFFGCKKKIRVVNAKNDSFVPGMICPVRVFEMTIPPRLSVGTKIQILRGSTDASKYRGVNNEKLEMKLDEEEIIMSAFLFIIEEVPFHFLIPWTQFGKKISLKDGTTIVTRERLSK